MTFKKFTLLLTCASALGVVACGHHYQPPRNLEDAKYWQRKNSSSAIYLRGPKAQQMLHKDISNCTNNIKELERLGEIRHAIPANYNNGNTLENRTASQQELDQWDSPERDGYLYAEHKDYNGFETCMSIKGWERVEYLPSSAIDKANQDYLDRYKRNGRNSSNRENVTTLNPAAQNPPPFKNLNE